ncbi:Transcription factor bHLH93-like protein [Drosera capensis]
MDQLNEDGFLEELLALGRETWEPNPPPEITTTFLHPNTNWAPFNDTFDVNPAQILPSHSYFNDFALSIKPESAMGELYAPFVPELADSSSSYGTDNNHLGALQFHGQQEVDYSFAMSMIDEAAAAEQLSGRVCGCGRDCLEGDHGLCCLDFVPESCIVANPMVETDPAVSISSGVTQRRKSKAKVEGQPSKNLMAERRRRKRLNDRLSMLRSVVPKISKMDRTSILGDTIDYMKELLEKINTLQEQIDDGGSNRLNVMNIFKDAKLDDNQVRTSPKFVVERGNEDTRVEISCVGKPGLLLSTIDTLEELGLEIQQCVISCFNDFSLQASCSERELITSEDIKQALFHKAGYGGRCP